jgi:hypothetical protein
VIRRHLGGAVAMHGPTVVSLLVIVIVGRWLARNAEPKREVCRLTTACSRQARPGGVLMPATRRWRAAERRIVQGGRVACS